MMWLSWRQARAQTMIAIACVAVAGVAALAAGRQDGTLRMWLGVLVVVAPGIVGVFWGAPLVADELQAGTFRLAWTQDVSRARWTVIRLLATSLGGLAVVGLLSVVVTWWAGPLDRAGLDQFGAFDSRDLVPVGYAAFALALGALAGALLRRTVPAMAVTLVAFTAVRVAFRLLIRPSLLPPAVQSLALDPSSMAYGATTSVPFIMPASHLQPAPPDLPNAWVTAVSIVNRNGTGLSASVLNRTCPGIGGGRAGGGGVLNPLAGGQHTSQAPSGAASAMHDCVTRLAPAYHEVVTYQPASRYWPLQWSELCLYLAAALALAALTVWRVRRIG
jgi:hypothetical protein